MSVYLPSDAILHKKRLEENTKITREEHARQLGFINEMLDFVQNDTDCRRVMLLAKFGEQFTPEECGGTCDNCLNENAVQDTDVTDIARQLVDLMQQFEARGRGKLSRTILVHILCGTSVKDLQKKNLTTLNGFAWAKGKGVKAEAAKRVLEKLISLEIIEAYISEDTPYGNDYIRVSCLLDLRQVCG
jgi:bloom syndrome protein